jgi:putative ATPase
MSYHPAMERRSPHHTPELFSADSDELKPLAERMRPSDLDEIVGQQRLLAPGKALRRALEAGRVHSMVLWGPPGCGKTTLALLVARYADADFRAISAVLSGLPEVRKALAEAEANFAQGRRTVLFVDEVHRFNKAQQDAFHRRYDGKPVLRAEFCVALALPRARARCGVGG